MIYPEHMIRLIAAVERIATALETLVEATIEEIEVEEEDES